MSGREADFSSFTGIEIAASLSTDSMLLAMTRLRLMDFRLRFGASPKAMPSQVSYAVTSRRGKQHFWILDFLTGEADR
jgi:hypothetical protein